MITNRVFDTNPIFFHAAGAAGLSPLWPQLRRYAECYEAPQIGADERYTVLTWKGGPASYWTDRPTPLEDSLQRLGVPCEPIGAGFERWRNTNKVQATLQALPAVSSEYVIICDATDVLVLGDPGQAVELLQRLDADVLYMGEDYFWPPEMLSLRNAQERIPGTAFTPYRYLNSGVLVARVKPARSCLPTLRRA